MEFWNEVRLYKDASDVNPFQEVSNLALVLLVLPWSNADVERAFSQLNLVKTSLRNRMSTTMVNALLTIRAGLKRVNKCCHNYELPTNVLRNIGTMVTYGSTESRPSTSTADDIMLEEEGEEDDELMF